MTQGHKVVKAGAGAAVSSTLSLWAFLRASNNTMLGRSTRRFTPLWRRHYGGPRKNLPFSVENKWQLLIMMAVYFGSGFAASLFIVFAVPFFIVKHQLLKK
ncbi:LOW QUALITY PROTEIN: cytochrome c oxidase subunit 7C, mitochondrial-like [Dugong dugon]